MTSEIELPDPLRDFLASTAAYASLIHGSSAGPLLVVKMPGHEIEGIKGRLPICLAYELHRRPSSPVIRMLLVIHDGAEYPLTLEMFINPDDEEQAADFEAFALAEEVRAIFYDEQLTHRLTKVMAQQPDSERESMLTAARRLLMAIPVHERNFDRAKVEVMERNPL